MFENIGGKIKTLAKVLCWVGIIVSIILVIILFISAGDASYSEEGLYRGLDFGFLFVAPLLSWISSFLLYGFGELIETNCEIARNTRHNNGQLYNLSKRESSVNPVVSDTSAKIEQVHTWVGNCDMCGNMIKDGDKFCMKCGTPVDGAAPGAAATAAPAPAPVDAAGNPCVYDL